MFAVSVSVVTVSLSSSATLIQSFVWNQTVAYSYTDDQRKHQAQLLSSLPVLTPIKLSTYASTSCWFGKARQNIAGTRKRDYYFFFIYAFLLSSMGGFKLLLCEYSGHFLVSNSVVISIKPSHDHRKVRW